MFVSIGLSKNVGAKKRERYCRSSSLT